MKKLISLVRFPNYVAGKTVRKRVAALEIVITPDFVWIFNSAKDGMNNRLLPVWRISRFLFASRMATNMTPWEAKQLTEELEEIASK